MAPQPDPDAADFVGADLVGADPFGTAAVRSRVLAGWSRSPERFREDANAEEDLALGGYRDRLVVELAQNAADAAVAGGVPGRLLLRLADGVLVAANTGAHLDGDGVVALSTLRASSKRAGSDVAAGTTGRFGVGFAAVLAVTDAPVVVGAGGGVRFDRERCAAAVAGAAREHEGLRGELERRQGHVPVLRLPWPVPAAVSGAALGEDVPAGYDTVVVLPLRDAVAVRLATALLREVDDALLLSLPGLAEVVVELPGEPARRVADVASRWTTVTRAGVHPPPALADRPTEERARPGWSLTWAVPLEPVEPVTTIAEASGRVPGVLHAPTPTDEPMSWPALLVADYPLDPTRRHVAPGPATDALTAQAGAAYADLLSDLARGGRDVVPLVPTGLPAGALDAALRDEAWRRLRAAPVLRGVETGDPVEPRDAVAMTGAVADDVAALAVLAPMLAGLVAAPRAAEPALRVLEVRRLDLAEVVDAMPSGDAPAVWARRYAGLASLAVDASAREALAGLPVPLADGRVVRGVRGLLLPGLLPGLFDGPAGGLASALGVLAAHGVRVVHPDALAADGAGDLLERLGAVPATATAVLDHPAVASAVAAGTDTDEPEEVADAVLAVVAAAWQERAWPPGERGWLAELALPDEDGDLTPAGLLVQPGSPAAALLDPATVGVLAAGVARAWPAEVLQAVGVAGTPVLVRCAQVDLADLPPELDELDGAREWAAEAAAGSVDASCAQVLAVRDLDLVLPDAWPALVSLLAGDADLRRAVTEPVVVEGADGGSGRVPSYSAWWLRRELGLEGAVAAPPSSGGGALPPFASLLPRAPAWAAGLDAGMRAALGLVASADDLAPGDWLRVLGRLGGEGEPSTPPSIELLLLVWERVARAADVLPDSPARSGWALGADLRPVAVQAGAAVVVDDPRWLQRRDLAPFVVAPRGHGAALADLLDLDLAEDRAEGRVTSPGSVEPVPAAVGAVLAAAPATWVAHDDLLVDGVAVDWWVEGSGAPLLHASTTDGLARALASGAGRWAERHRLEAVLQGTADPVAVQVEDALG